MSLYTALLNPIRHFEAFRKILRKARQDTPGIDGMTLTRFGREKETRIASIVGHLAVGTHEPKHYLRTLIPKITGGHREGCLPTASDRVVLGVLAGELAPLIAQGVSRCAFGYMPKRGLQTAIRSVRGFITAENRWAVVADIRACFPSVDLRSLAPLLGHVLGDEVDSLQLVWKFLRSPVAGVPRDSAANQGLRTGLAISPSLCDLSLTEGDFAIEANAGPFVRYADNYYIPAPSRAEAERRLAILRSELARTAGQSLGTEMIVDLDVCPAEFLGLEIGPAGNAISCKSLTRIEMEAERQRATGERDPLEYLRQVSHHYRTVADISPITQIERKVRGSLPSGGGVAFPPGPGILAQTAKPQPAGPGGGAKHPPPPAVCPRSATGSAGRGARWSKRFPNREPMFFLPVALAPGQLELLAMTMRVARQIGNSNKRGRLVELICMEFLGAYGGGVARDSGEFLGHLMAHIEQGFGIRVVAVDEKRGRVIYGREHLGDDSRAAEQENPTLPNECESGLADENGALTSWGAAV